jgi:hypothetical protein
MASLRAQSATLTRLLTRRPRALTALGTIDRFEADKLAKDDRGTILVSVALVEQLIEDAILAKCLKKFDNKPYRDRLFSGTPELGGAVTTLSGKITLAHALGIFGPLAREDLDRLRKIRNAAAHAKTSLRFNSRVIKDAVSFFHVLGPTGLGIGKTARTNTPRGKFLSACGFYMIFLYVVAKRSRRYRPKKKRRDARKSFFYS